jgi:hypothetical protein
LIAIEIDAYAMSGLQVQALLRLLTAAYGTQSGHVRSLIGCREADEICSL